LPAEPRHASFDDVDQLGSINYQLNKNGITEGILSAESMIFWLDTADSKATTPYFYISKGIEVAEGEEKPAERMFMYNATDSMSIFDENSAVPWIVTEPALPVTTIEEVALSIDSLPVGTSVPNVLAWITSSSVSAWLILL